MFEHRYDGITTDGAQHIATAPATDPVTAIEAEPLPSAKAAGRESSCSTCYLRSVCLPCGLSSDKLADIDHLTREKRKVVRGDAVYRRGDTFQALYVVRSGSFKSVAIIGAQQEKVTGLHLPAEILGLDAISRHVHDYDAIALEDAEVCVLPYVPLTQLAVRLPELQSRLLSVLSRDIARDCGLMLRLGGMSAEQRVAAFLLGLSTRYQKLGYDNTRFSMRMAREDIASYLGLTSETVSRVFSRLQRDGLIELHQRAAHLRSLPVLRERVGY